MAVNSRSSSSERETMSKRGLACFVGEESLLAGSGTNVKDHGTVKVTAVAPSSDSNGGDAKRLFIDFY